ncbi:isopentenyl transferase family protein [Cupriavidus sp. UYPR2.512]|uniref:isopentenyl transferase family protein n=1 Tax=Cupriavidus sp. UYPR2.512 TaxID=1080187 RepID=UPI00035E16F5|nr:isopentenyl transferase family protein [Cupriavidus sp. UYPR2.512]UIF88378.1 isopentenyl transferase [Cupriavidus necator]
MKRLHFIVGPTTTGKTRRSVALAEQTDAPVIVLDRIQCFPDLAVGSGRPAVDELRSTRRVYIADRKVADGELAAATANAFLHEHVARLLQKESLLILEGGSVSLLRTIAADPRWATYEQTWERLALQDVAGYLSKAKSRIREMLAPADGSRSMLDEIAGLWPDARTHAVLNGIVGYRSIIAYADRYRIPVGRLPHALSPGQSDQLVQEIAGEYFVYARWQERELPVMSGRSIAVPKLEY